MELNPRRLMPVRVAYTWFVCFAIIAVVPFVWYVLNNVTATIVEAMVTEFPGSFNGTTREAACTLFSNVWAYMPAVILIPVFVWAVMRTLKERRSSYY